MKFVAKVVCNFCLADKTWHASWNSLDPILFVDFSCLLGTMDFQHLCTFFDPAILATIKAQESRAVPGFLCLFGRSAEKKNHEILRMTKSFCLHATQNHERLRRVLFFYARLLLQSSEAKTTRRTMKNWLSGRSYQYVLYVCRPPQKYTVKCCRTS